MLGEWATGTMYPFVHITILLFTSVNCPPKKRDTGGIRLVFYLVLRECYTWKLLGAEEAGYCIQRSKRRACLRLGQAVGKRSERGLEVSTDVRSLFLRGQPELAC